jgi:hypothetical protein
MTLKMTSERTPTEQPSPSPAPKTSKKTAFKITDQPVPWYGRLLIAGVMIGATIEFFRLLFMAIMMN